MSKVEGVNTKDPSAIVVTLSRKFQIFSGHYKCNLDILLPYAHLDSLEEPKSIKDEFFNPPKGSKISARTYIPLPDLTNEQIEEFKILDNMMIFMDSKQETFFGKLSFTYFKYMCSKHFKGDYRLSEESLDELFFKSK